MSNINDIKKHQPVSSNLPGDKVSMLTGSHLHAHQHGPNCGCSHHSHDEDEDEE